MTPRAPKLLFVVGQLDRGGAERQLYLLCRALPGERIVVSLTGPGEWSQPLRDAGVRVIELHRSGHRDPRRLWQLILVMRRERPDVVHVFTDGPQGLYGRVAREFAFAPPLLVGDRCHGAAEPAWYRPFKRLFNGRADRIVSNSDANARWLEAHGLVDPLRALVIPNGLELPPAPMPADRTAARALLGLDPAAPLIGTVARLTSVKGPELFLHAAALVALRRPDVRFVWVGDGPLRDGAARLARELRIEASVTFAGLRRDVPAILPVFDVFALTSHSEGMPNGIMEAQAAALPVVTTAVGDAPVLVEEGVTGHVVRPGDVDGLAGHLLALVEDPARARRFGLAARASIERYTVERMVGAYAALYDELLAARRAP